MIKFMMISVVYAKNRILSCVQHEAFLVARGQLEFFSPALLKDHKGIFVLHFNLLKISVQKVDITFLTSLFYCRKS